MVSAGWLGALAGCQPAGGGRFVVWLSWSNHPLNLGAAMTHPQLKFAPYESASNHVLYVRVHFNHVFLFFFFLRSMLQGVQQTDTPKT